MTYDIERLRTTEFPWADATRIAYLNHASTGPLPSRTVEALAAFNALRAEPHRISHEAQFGVLDAARERCARLVRAQVGEIALMVNTGYGINLAARALPLRQGDVVVASDREFPANVYPWMALGDRGVRLELIPCRDDLPDEEALVAAIARPEVRVCAVSWVSFASGARVDLGALSDACREHDAFLVVDAIQGVGPTALDLRSVAVDILACGAQKWLLGPWGTGFVYVRHELVHTLRPVDVSWMATAASDEFSSLLRYDPELRSDARRFEMITLPFQDFVGMAASLDLLFELGLSNVEGHVRALADRVVEWALDRSDVQLITPAAAERRSGVVALAPPDAERVSERLKAAGVVHSLREGAIRLSPHCYNTADEIDRALDVIGSGR